MTAIPIYNSKSLQFSELVSTLSQQSNLPSSIKVRNRLLSPWTISSPPNDWTTSSSVHPDPDPWSTLSLSSNGTLEVYAFGTVPQDILKEKARIVNDQSLFSTPSSSLWALVILSPPLHDDHKSHAPRMAFWISSESFVFSGSRESLGPEEKLAKILEEEERLLFFIINDWLPSKLKEPMADDRGSLGQKPDSIDNEKKSIVLCGFEQRLVDLIQVWSSKDESKITVSWVNSCLVYMRNGEPKRDYSKETLIDGRWKIGKIEERDVELVQKSNKLSFPLEYVRGHLAHSVLLRDSLSQPTSSSNSTNMEPNSKAGDQAVGWVYTHDDLSLASLQVLPSYRRFNSKSESNSQQTSVSSADSNSYVSQPNSTSRTSTESSLGIGSHILNLASSKVINVQDYALSKAGVSKSISSPSASQTTNRDIVINGRSRDPVDSKPCFAVTEVSNTGACKFFEKNGFKMVQKNAWMAVNF